MTVTEIWLGIPATEAAQSAMLDKGYQIQPHTHGAHRQRYVMALRIGHYHTVEACMAAVTRIFGVPRIKLVGRARSRPIVRPRWAAMWVARELGHTFQEIADKFDRDHSTVVHACQGCENVQLRDAAYRDACERVMSMVRSA